MKISKVNHVRSAVSVREDGGQGGILYDSPIKDGRDTAEVDITAHIEGLNRRAQALYSILSPLKKQYGPDRKLIPVTTEEILIRRNFSLLIKFLIKRPKYDDPEDVRLSKQKSTLFGIHKYEILNNRKTGKSVKGPDLGVRGDAAYLMRLSEEIADKSLRRAFRRVVTIDGKEVDLRKVSIQLMFAMTQIQPERKGPYIAALKQLSDEEILAFFAVLHKDYTKEQQCKDMEESIRRQNVRVQPVEKDGRYLLTISGAEDKNKAFFHWMQDYAAASEEGKAALILEFRRMLILFFKGEKAYSQSLSDAGMTAFSFGDSISEGERFLPDIYKSMLHFLTESYPEAEDPEHQYVNMPPALTNQIKDRLHQCYKQATAGDRTKRQILHIRYIQDVTKRLLVKTHIRPARFHLKKLAGEVFREWTSYCSMKYIDLGKAVYHFAMPAQLDAVHLSGASFGKLLPGFEKGISSFDYERIKADETIQREMSGFISFAVGNFSRSAYDADAALLLAEKDGKPSEADDVLYLPVRYLKQTVYKDSVRKILRFFGGLSNWAGTPLYTADPLELVMAIRESLRMTRNHNFHYSGTFVGENHKLVKLMCAKEYQELGRIYRRRWYSNNVLMFYTDENITRLMDELYKKDSESYHHIPAFQRLFATGEQIYSDVIFAVNPENEASFLKPDSELMMQYQACLFFLAKEIYYFSFIQHPQVMNMVKTALSEMEAEDRDKSHSVAMQSFKERMSVLPEDAAFEDLCEMLLTDYNMQNNNMRRQAAAAEKVELFGHYKVLLYLATRRAFVKYLKGEEMQEYFRFLFTPFMHGENPVSQVEFEGSWSPHTFNYLKEVAGDELCLAWYVTAHFLDRNQLNKLTGKIRGYLTFLQNVDNRAASTRNRKGTDTAEKIRQYSAILEILQFAKVFVGLLSQNPFDYYADYDEYGRYLSHYLNFVPEEGKEYEAALAFHEACVPDAKWKITPYFVNKEPVVNSNVVFAQMYGNEKLIGEAVRPISVEEVKEYRALTVSFRPLFNKKAADRDEEETKNYYRYARLKNR